MDTVLLLSTIGLESIGAVQKLFTICRSKGINTNAKIRIFDNNVTRVLLY